MAVPCVAAPDAPRLSLSRTRCFSQQQWRLAEPGKMLWAGAGGYYGAADASTPAAALAAQKQERLATEFHSHLLQCLHLISVLQLQGLYLSRPSLHAVAVVLL